MSTKTNFKRIALVAVSALGFGLLSITSSTAAEELATNLTNVSLVETSAGSASVGVGTAADITARFTQGNGNTTNGDTYSFRAAIIGKPSVGASETLTPVAPSAGTPAANCVVTVGSVGTLAAITATSTAGNGCKSAATNQTLGRILFTPDTAGAYLLLFWHDANLNGIADGSEKSNQIAITAGTPVAGSVVISAPVAFASGVASPLLVGSSVAIPLPALYSFTATNTAAVLGGAAGTATHAISATVSGPAAPGATAFTTPLAATSDATKVTAAVVQTGTSGGTRTLTTTATGAGVSGPATISVSATNFSFTPLVAGTYTVTFSGAGLTSYVVSAVVVNDTSRAVWSLGTGSTATMGTGTRSATTGNYSIGATVTGSLQYVVLSPSAGTLANAFVGVDGVTPGNYNSLTVIGSTFANSTAGFANGTYNLGATLGTATTISYTADPGAASQVWVNTPVAGGSITLEWRAVRTDPVSLVSSNTVYQTITITSVAPGAVNEAKSTAVITGVNPGSATGVVDDGEELILAPMTLATAGGVTSGIGTAKAVIEVSLKDVNGLALIGSLPSVGASIEGPGTLSLSVNNGMANSDASTGRYLVTAAGTAGSAGSPFAAGSSTFYINVFSDGTNGVATVNIWVGGKIWKTKTVSFYGAVSKLTASSDRKVLRAGVTSPTTPCVLVATCDSSTVALTPAVQVIATDNKDIAVPYRSYTAVPDKTVITGSAKTSNDVVADSIGATWFDLTTSPNAVSGNTGSVSYTVTLADGVTKIASNAVSFAIGGAPVAVTVALASGASSDIGAQSSLVFTDKDAQENAPYDLDVPLALKSNVALVVGTSANTAGTALPASIAMIGGTGTIKFFNPLVPGTVTISGLAAGLIPVSVTFPVKNAAADAQSAAAIAAAEAAADAAAEAIDAANAATDAANLAAEAADAATVAAEEARDAADAATAAVEELATQVATLMAALKAQITTLANTVAKIAKKVKA